MIVDYKKPSVNSKEHEWVAWDFGTPTFGHEGDSVQLYRQYRILGQGGYTDHYRLKVNGKWIKKTFFGESAWCNVERCATDEYGVAITA